MAPTLPYSPALQLANTILLLGLNPSEKATCDRVRNVQTSPSTATSINDKVTSVCYRSPPSAEQPWPVPPVPSSQQRPWCSLYPKRLSGLPEPHNDLQSHNQVIRHRNQSPNFGSGLNCTRISESFDDAKDVDDLPADQHIVDLHSDVLLTSQSVSQRGQAAFKATAGSWFGTTDIPGEKKKKRGRFEDPE